MVATVMVMGVHVSRAWDAERGGRASMIVIAVGVRLARFDLDAEHLPARHAEHGLGEQQHHGGELDGPRSHREGEL